MRRAIFALLLAGSLLASPALAAGSRPPIYLDVGRNFTTGARFYFHTLGAWLDDLLGVLGLKGRGGSSGEGTACQASSPCGSGLVCLNVCADASCGRFEKRCVKGANHVVVLGEYSPCSAKDLCMDGTDCTDVCPQGMDCGDAAYRCLKPVAPSGHCDIDSECLSTCGQLPYPPIGPSAYAASCVQGACRCATLLTKPGAARVACPENMTQSLSCPTGTHAGCAASDCATGDCPPMLTCLTAPAYGGECLGDAECSDAACPQGSEPFCGDDRRCKCRVKEVQTIACQTAAECGAGVCAANEIAACVNGACACAPAGVVSSCQTDAECAACPQDYTPACQSGSCTCQKTKVVPFACQTVDDCGAVSCPEGYDKGCQDSVCVCSRQVPQP